MKPFEKLIAIMEAKTIEEIIGEVERYPKGNCDSCVISGCPENKKERRMKKVLVSIIINTMLVGALGYIAMTHDNKMKARITALEATVTSLGAMVKQTQEISQIQDAYHSALLKEEMGDKDFQKATKKFIADRNL